MIALFDRSDVCVWVQIADDKSARKRADQMIQLAERNVQTLKQVSIA